MKLDEEKIKQLRNNLSTPYEIISKGIQNSKALPYQPFIKEELENQGFKNLPKHDPWLYIDEVTINEMKGFLFVNMDGFYCNCMNPEEITFIMTWDNIYNLQLFDSNDSERKDMAEGLINLLLSCDENENPDEAMVLSLFIEGYSSKTNSPFSVIKSIYDNIWKRMIDEFRGQPIVWGSHIDWFTQEEFSSIKELIDFYSNYQSKDEEKKTKDQKEKEALEKLGTTKKGLAEKVLKNISVSQENPEAYAFVKAVSAKGANMQDILTKYEHIFDDHINFTDEDGYTAMHYACWDNKRIILEMLIDFGANPNVVSPTNETPLNMAVVSGHFEIVQFFVDYDFEMELNIDWENRNKTENPFHSKKGSTLIRDAVLNQHWDIFDILIDGIGPNIDVLTEPCSVGFEGETNFFLAIEKLYQSKNIDYNKERLDVLRSVVESSTDTSRNKKNTTKPAEKEAELKTENKNLSKDASIWEIIQHEFINLGKESVVKKEFSNLILSEYPHIKKGTLGAQISIQVINKRGRTNYAQCSKERVCGDNKYDFLFENDDKTLCKYDKDKHGIWEIYKRDDGKLDVRK